MMLEHWEFGQCMGIRKMHLLFHEMKFRKIVFLAFVRIWLNCGHIFLRITIFDEPLLFFDS